MYRYLVAVLALFCVPAATSGAQTLTADERAFINQHIWEIVQIEPKRVADPVVEKVFAVPLYFIPITIGDKDAGPTTSLTTARMGSQLVLLSLPAVEGNVSDLQKMLNPSFRIASPDDAKTLQLALDATYPNFTMSDEKESLYRRVGNRWAFVRAAFPDGQAGFIFETDAKGAITAVKWSLKLPRYFRRYLLATRPATVTADADLLRHSDIARPTIVDARSTRFTVAPRGVPDLAIGITVTTSFRPSCSSRSTTNIIGIMVR